MATTGAQIESAITLKIPQDLSDKSHLKDFLQDNRKALLTVGKQLALFAADPAHKAISAGSVQFTVDSDLSWKTPSGISFGLKPSASCKLQIGTASQSFSAAKTIDSGDTMDIVSDAATEMVYVNIEVDFDIQGSAAGAGTVGVIGIAGKASGGATSTFVYCHPVSPDTPTSEAIRQAFSAMVLPFAPDSLGKMTNGSLAKCNFDGTFACEVDVSYGAPPFSFSAPSVELVRKSLGVAVKLPKVDVDLGANASVQYKQSDHFSVIVQKKSDSAANVYLARSDQKEFGASVGFTVGVTTTKVDVKFDNAIVKKAVDKLTAGIAGDAVSSHVDDLKDSLLSKLNKWISSNTGETSLVASLSNQRNRAVLFNMQADLTSQALPQTWDTFAKGDLAAALKAGGLSVQAGSGIAEHASRKTALELHFFNLFALTSTDKYFRDSTVEIGPDGNIRFLYDVGRANEVQTKKTDRNVKVHFVATAESVANSTRIDDVEVDLCYELSQTNKADEMNRIADSIGSLPSTLPVNSAQSEMKKFVVANKSGTLQLTVLFKPSAYSRLTCSVFSGPKNNIPPALPQSEDADNWNAFRDASKRLLSLWFVEDLHYSDWKAYNCIANGIDEKGTPNRRNRGNPAAVGTRFYTDRRIGPAALQAAFFFDCSQRFMCLCDDLHSLASLAGQVDDMAKWNSLVEHLSEMTKNVDCDYSKPALRAILERISEAGVQADADVQSTAKSLVCKLTVT